MKIVELRENEWGAGPFVGVLREVPAVKSWVWSVARESTVIIGGIQQSKLKAKRRCLESLEHIAKTRV